MQSFDKVNSNFQIQQYNQGGIDAGSSTETGSMPNGRTVQSPSSENLLASKGFESEAHSTMRDSGTQISKKTQSHGPTSFKTSQHAKNQGVKRTNEKGKIILGGLSSYSSPSSVGADTSELGSTASSRTPHITPSKLLSSSPQLQLYKDARTKLKPKQDKLEAFISIADGALQKPKNNRINI